MTIEKIAARIYVAIVLVYVLLAIIRYWSIGEFKIGPKNE